MKEIKFFSSEKERREYLRNGASLYEPVEVKPREPKPKKGKKSEKVQTD